MNAILKAARVRPVGTAVKRQDSAIEAMFAQGLRALKFPPWQRNYIFLEGRGYELDFAWPELRFGIEIEGEVHRIKERFHSDIEKHALAFLAGWPILRLDGRSIRSGQAFRWAESAMWERRGLA